MQSVITSSTAMYNNNQDKSKLVTVTQRMKEIQQCIIQLSVLSLGLNKVTNVNFTKHNKIFLSTSQSVHRFNDVVKADHENKNQGVNQTGGVTLVFFTGALAVAGHCSTHQKHNELIMSGPRGREEGRHVGGTVCVMLRRPEIVRPVLCQIKVYYYKYQTTNMYQITIWTSWIYQKSQSRGRANQCQLANPVKSLVFWGCKLCGRS